ncbi:hypothetical protein K7X08_018273 [Anisodus acutangulus]|uniref:DUF641 domain-containing protein n=1 Tax=Anisodus acutangulus TaxID=402998 RepID=A0A9Q1LY49_9SOLA|nr:hypothetical protein K7X08_018273 [Anisodus acutangulus]
MVNKVSNFSDLIQRVTASCLLHPLSSTRIDGHISDARDGDESEDDKYTTEYEDEQEEEDTPYVETQEKFQNFKETKTEKVIEMEMLLGEVFDAVWAMKKAYVSLQEAHCPWDQDKMRVADVAVISELKRLGVLRERYRRNARSGRGEWRVGAATLREVVAPYESAVDELRQEVKAKENEINYLKEKLKTTTLVHTRSSSGKKNKSKRKATCSSEGPVNMSPAPDLFEGTLSLVKEASKSFTRFLLSLMRSANWDIAAAVRSIEAASSNSTTPTSDPIVGPNHAKYALESYVNRKMFQGFDHETFYMDGTLSSLLNPDQHRRECFTQYRDMKAMDPMELLGILPTCSFGNFCFKKYLAIVHPKMEESLFGDLEQRRQVLAGNHPRSQFYGEFLGLAKAVWLLHLLAFSLDPPPSHFEASNGSEFHPKYMESVVKYSISMGIGGGMGMGLVVGFPVSPGFKLGNGSVVKARVYLVPKNGF